MGRGEGRLAFPAQTTFAGLTCLPCDGDAFGAGKPAARMCQSFPETGVGFGIVPAYRYRTVGIGNLRVVLPHGASVGRAHRPFNSRGFRPIRWGRAGTIPDPRRIERLMSMMILSVKENKRHKIPK